MSTLAEEILQQARDAGLRITTAESCTGGMIVASLIDIAGSSDVVDGGFVAGNAGNDDVSSVGGGLGSGHDEITIEDADVDHRVAFDFERVVVTRTR